MEEGVPIHVPNEVNGSVCVLELPKNCGVIELCSVSVLDQKAILGTQTLRKDATQLSSQVIPLIEAKKHREGTIPVNLG